MRSRLRKLISEISNGEDLKAKIGRGVFWSFLGTLISKSIGVIGFIVIARLLSVEDYGKLGIIRSTIITFSMFSVASFGTTAIKYIAIYNEKDKLKASRIITMTRIIVFLLAAIISISVFLLSEYISINFLKDKSLDFAVKLTAPTIFFTAMNGLQNGILSGFERFKYLANINILNGIVAIPILIILTYLFGINGTFIAILINSCLLWGVSLFLMFKVLRENKIIFNLNNINMEFYIIKEFTLPAFLSGMIVTPVILICNLILTNSENGYKELGIYSAAFNFSVISMTLNGIIGQVLYPYTMKLFKTKNKKFDFFNIIFPFFLGIIINLPIILFPDLVSKIFGDKYFNQQMWYSLIFVSISTIIISFKQGIARNFAAGNHMWWSLLSNATWGSIAVLATYYLVNYGAIGRSFAFTMAYLLTNILFVPFYLHKGLIDKKLLVSKYSLIVWIIIFTAMIFYIFIDKISVRIFILIVLSFIITFIIKKWYSNYIRSGVFEYQGEKIEK